MEARRLTNRCGDPFLRALSTTHIIKEDNYHYKMDNRVLWIPRFDIVKTNFRLDNPQEIDYLRLEISDEL